MGLSLRNIGKRIGDIAGGVERQINPLDAGLSYKTKVAAPQNAQQSAASQAFNGFVKPVVQLPIQFSENFSNTFANLGNKLGGGQNQTIQQNMGGGPLLNKTLQFSGATGQNKQLAGDVAQIGLTAAAPGESKIIEGGVAHALPGVANTVLPRVVSNAAIAGGFNATSAAGNGATLPQVFKAGGQAALVGGALPLAGEGIKAIAPTNKVAFKQIGASQAGYAKVPHGQNSVAADLSPKQAEFINDYANMLKGMGQGNGVAINPETGARISNNVRTAETKGKNMTEYDWFNEARKQIESGKGAYGASEDYKTLPTLTKSAQPIGVGKNVNKPAVSVPKVRLANDPELQSLYDTATKAQKLSPMEQLHAEDAVRRRMGQRNTEAEQAALLHLKNGGTRDEAIKIYQKTAGTSAKDAAFRVQRAAKQADQALHPNEGGTNPEIANFEGGQVAAGDHATAKSRYKIVNSLADFHQKQSLKALDKLSPTDRADFVHYTQGVKDIASAENPTAVQTAVDAFRKGADTIHALDTQYAGGKTRYIKSFFPDYWDTPENQALLQHKAEQQVEENVGPEAWRNMTNDERQQALGEFQQRISLDTGNYQGFRNQQRLFANRQEGLNAGFKPRFADPAEDIKNYFTSAKLKVAPEALIKATRAADTEQARINKSVDLPGDTSFQTSEAGYKVLKGLERQDKSSVLWKPYDTASSAATQAIVLNPIFHGANQLVQGFVASGRALGLRGGPGGGLSFLKNAMDLSAEDSVKYSRDFLKDGGHYPTYGKNSQGIIAKATHGATNINRSAMAGIEARLRTSAYKSLVDSGMDGKEAVKAIDHYMGAGDAFSPGTRRGTLFLHYFKTMGNALAGHAIHPVENAGSTANLIIAAAATYAVSRGLQDVTGNKKAYVRPAGELSLGKEIIGSGADIVKGHYRQAADILTNRVNPVLKEGVTQLYGKDLFTGQDIKDRKQHAEEALLAPLQQGSKVTAGKKSLPEIAANQLQINTPHAKGYKASEKVAFLNTPGAKSGNGLKGQAAYYDSMEQASKTLNDRDAQKFKEITSTETDAAGNKVGLSDKQTQSKNLELSANPRVLAAYTKQKQDYAKATGQKLDPLYDDKQITPEQRATYLRIQGTPYKSDDYNNLIDQNKDWVKPLNDARNTYFDSVDFSQAPKSERVLPPKFDSQTESDFSAADLLDGKQKTQFILDHPNLQDAYDKIAQYTNDRRAATGYSKFNLYPEAPADVQGILNTYNALPQHDGSKGGNKTRSLWIQAHPGDYAKMTDYMTKTSVYQLANNAGKAKYEGADLNQQALKAAYSLGQYDIVKNADGTYSLGNSSSSGGSGGSGGYGGKKYVSRTAAELQNPYFNAIDIGAGGKPKIGKASKPKTSKTVSFKSKKAGYQPKTVAAVSPTKLKVNLKKSRV